MILVGDTAHHLTRVLRLKTGDKIIVFDQSGYEWDAEIINKKRKSVEIELLDRHKPDVESPVNITLLQSLSRSHRMDLVMQKATELGVSSIVPILTNNTVVKLNAKNTQKKMHHWKKITISAAEQSGRVRLPELFEPRELSESLLNEHKKEESFFLDTTGSENFSGNVKKSVSIAIGPEGGLAQMRKKWQKNLVIELLKLDPDC